MTRLGPVLPALAIPALVLAGACAEPDALSVRQDRPAQTAGIGLTGRIHFNTQTADFARARAFYRMLGFTAGVGGFPKTNTHEMARTLGMNDLCSYEIQEIEVISIPDSWGPTSIDLIQFAVPFNPEPPYASPTHLGMAYAALLTTDLAADVSRLRAEGVELLSEPYGVPGDRFVFFTDPDGVWFKLVETTPPHGDPDADMHIRAMPYVALNVSDFERSLAFYRRLGYTETRPLPSTGSLNEARAYGLDAPFERRAAEIAIPGGDRHRLRLVQWLDPSDDDPPYPPPINHIGIDRIALAVTDLDRAVSILRDEGAEFLSEIAPCCSGTSTDETGIVNLIDPDGIFLELVGQIARRDPVAPPEWCEAD
jgi:catechol 2,3-dioxygenase-like lactoylglutathione lyase family enzyme